MIATTALAIVSATQALAAIRAENEKTIVSNSVGAAVCFIAFLHYILLSRPGKDIMSIRYSDWFFTLPLLLIEIFLICGIDIIDNIWMFLFLIMLIMGMLITGWMAVRSLRSNGTNYTKWLVAGTICLVAIYLIVLGVLERDTDGPLQTATIIFFLMWTLYGFVSFYQRTGNEHMSQAAYDILDIVTKAVFGLVVAAFAFNEKTYA
jgi:bacteriorhodopsin